MSIPSLPPEDAAIIGTLAHKGGPEALAFLGLQAEWLTSKNAQLVASAGLSLQRQGKVVNMHNVNAMVGARIKPLEWLPIDKVWRNGYGEVDAQLAINQVRSTYKARQVTRIKGEMEQLLRDQPAEIDEWLPDLQAQLKALSESTKVYDPRPSAIYQQQAAAIMFPSLLPEFGAVLRGGYWAPSLMIWCGISGHGKSTTLYTATVDVMLQGRSLCFFNNERSTRVVLDRVLLALTRLGRSEIELRQGSTPERHEILTKWLAYLDAHLRIYGSPQFTTKAMTEVVENDRPDVAVFDYFRDSPGMLSFKSQDPVGDLGYWALDLMNAYNICGLGGTQMSDQAAKDFKKDDANVPEIAYKTARLYHASNAWIGVKLDSVVANMSYQRVRKDNLTNMRDTEHHLPFNPVTWVYQKDRLVQGGEQ